MTTDLFRHKLECLGWRTWGEEFPLESGRWLLCAFSCGHTIIAIGDSRREIWSAACSTALNVTRNGSVRP
jgi:hypothetical protein